MRRNKKREQYIAEVVKAWNEFPSRDKVDFMSKHPDLYFAVAWLSAHENVRKRFR